MFFLLMFITPITGFAEIGTHNFTVNVGGTFSYDMIDDNGVVPSLVISPNTTDFFLGGGFNIEIGHLYIHQKYIIHALDTRVSFGLNISDLHRVDGRLVLFADGADNYIRTLHFYAGTTYAIGREIGLGQILIDIVGVNLGYLNTKEVRETSTSKEAVYSGSIFTLSGNLPLGIQYIFDNGWMLGFKHRLTFAFSGTPTIKTSTVDDVLIYQPTSGGLYGLFNSQAKYLSYNLTLSVGYVFGK